MNCLSICEISVIKFLCKRPNISGCLVLAMLLKMQWVTVSSFQMRSYLSYWYLQYVWRWSIVALLFRHFSVWSLFKNYMKRIKREFNFQIYLTVLFLTKSAFEFIQHFPFENKYDEDKNTKEYIICVQDDFSGAIFVKRRNDFQNPRNSHYRE